MTRRSARIGLTLLLLLSLLAPASAWAGGWGPYFGWSRAEPSTGIPGDIIELSIAALPDSVKGLARTALENLGADFRLDHLTFGVLYDSAPSRDKLFSYRMTLGFDIASTQLEGIRFNNALIPGLGSTLSTLFGDVDADGYGFSTTHTFAFGLLRTDLLRWWIGPGIGLHFNYYDLGGLLDLKSANLSVGGGGETGVNVHLGDAMSIALSGGVHWNAFAYGIGSSSVGSLVWGDGPYYLIRLALLLHTGQDRHAW